MTLDYVRITGNLGRDPQTRVNANNTFIANFSIAVNVKRKTSTGDVEQTDWYNITATGKQAEVLAQYARQGDRLFVEGRQSINPWTDREGNPRVSVDVLVQDFEFLGDHRKNASGDTASDESGSLIPEDIREELAALTSGGSGDFSGAEFPNVM